LLSSLLFFFLNKPRAFFTTSRHTTHTTHTNPQNMPPKSRLTVAQLKAELDTLGVPYDAKAKKAVLVDLLVSPSGTTRFESPRITTRHTHGTGCTLASALAAGLAQGMALQDAVARARNYVRAAMLAAPGYGAGHGPLDHTVTLSH
jgi:hypothetical protein